MMQQLTTIRAIGFAGLGFCALLLALCFPASAQQPKKTAKIGYLSIFPGLVNPDQTFIRGLRELGYIEGQNIAIEWRFTKGKTGFSPEDAATLVRLNPDCIVVVGNLAVRAAMKATKTIPIVMANASDDPVKTGLVASLARPGGNVTGFVDVSSDLTGKRLELLKEAVPKASRIGILWDPSSPAGAGEYREIKPAAEALAVQLQSLEVRRPEDFELAFRSAKKEHIGALIVASFGGLFHSQRELILNLAVKTRLPAMYTLQDYVRVGGLMSYTADLDDQYRRAAGYVDKILKGTTPADLPVQQPTKFEFVVNLKVAQQIGLAIPPNVLARATRIIR